MRAALLCALALIVSTRRVRADDAPPPLADAVVKGDAAEVTRLLDGGADPDTTWSGYTMLTWAAMAGKLPVVKVLVDHHATVEPPIKSGFTPLVAAVSNHQPEIAEYLLAHGAKVNLQSDAGWTPLDDAEGNHDAKSAKVIRAHGGVTGLPPLLGAVNRGEVAKVKKLLASGADPNSHDTANGTALSIAANVGSLAIVKLLVEHKAAIDTASTSGWTALMEATQNGHKDIVDYLIAHGAALDLRNGQGQTALAIAVETKHPDVAKLLRDHGATDAPPPADAPAAAAPAPPTDEQCAVFRKYAELGSSGYASLVGGPPDELTHDQPASEGFDGATCTVSADDKTFLCVWKDHASDYDGAASFVAQCSKGEKIATEAGKTIVWWGGVPAKTLIKVYVADTDLVVKFFAGGS